MLEDFNWLPYLFPPLLGALIGYITNYIAIRMLFRPLKAWRVLGFRLPLTPGIIPSKRDELASRMGEMVGSHLLTAEDVRSALEKPSFRRELKSAVNYKLGSFLERDLGALGSLVPNNYQKRFGDLVQTLRLKALDLIGEYLASETFDRQLRQYIVEKREKILQRDLESFLTPEQYQALLSHLELRFTALLQSKETASLVQRFVDQRLERILQSNQTLRDLLPNDLIEVLLDQLDREVPPLLEKFGGLLYDPDFRERLSLKIRQGINSFVDSLSGLAGLLSGFINLDKVYKKIPEFLDKAGEELSRWLREEKTQQQIASLLRDRLEALLDKPVGSFFEKAPYEKVAGFRNYLCERSVAAVQSRKTLELALGFTSQMITRIKDRPFQEILETNLPHNGIERLEDILHQKLLQTARSSESREALNHLLKLKLEEMLYQKPLGRLSERLPADVHDELEQGFYRQVGEVLQKEVPPLIETLNVSQMVEDKVNQLNIIEVEGLLMGVMKEQFKYINLFGALLGLLIGLVNIAVWWLF